jgi:thioredoxin 1
MMPMSAVTINNENHKKILRSKKPVLIDFWASWCDTCLKQLPVIEEFGDEMKGCAIVAELNIDDHPEIASQYAVVNLPALLLLKRGKIVQRRNGYTSKKKLRSMMTSVIPQYQ